MGPGSFITGKQAEDLRRCVVVVVFDSSNQKHKSEGPKVNFPRIPSSRPQGSRRCQLYLSPADRDHAMSLTLIL